MPRLACLLTLLLVTMMASAAPAMAQGAPQDAIFVEAENFTVQGEGWRINQNAQARQASRATTLNGSTGPGDSVATHEVTIPQAGKWRLWTRYMYHASWRGPFDLAITQNGQSVGQKTYDQATVTGTANWGYHWEPLDIELAQGHITLTLAKHQKRSSSGYVRNVDCFLLTQDLDAKPDHIPFGPQTWMRVTLRDGHDGPVQIHIFADRFRAPWYAHYALSKDGVEPGLNPKRPEARLVDGETTGWANVSEMIYQDSGAILQLYPAHTYHNIAKRFNAVIELAPSPQDSAIVKRIEVDQQPPTMFLLVPPNLETPENIARLKQDLEISQELGAIADNMAWPTVGQKPRKFPFFIAANLDPSRMSSQVIDREIKTLDHFGFNGINNHPRFDAQQFPHQRLGGIGWYYKGTYSQPDVDRLKTQAVARHKRALEAGVRPENLAFAMLMDEPGGQLTSVITKDAPSQEAFVAWLKQKGLTPQTLLVGSWDDVKLVTEAQRNDFPALHYYTQIFRTVALGQFMALQKDMVHEAWQTPIPVNVNFSDGAIYYANMFGQGVDYFALLRETDQNAIWGEDWSNRSSTFHCAAYNVDLMRAAARQGKQLLGHYLIAYAGRKGYDIRLKAVSEAARGVKVFTSFAYGPNWASHERSSWQQFPHLWHDHALALREIGAVEDWLIPAMPKDAQVALIYSSAADAWAHAQGDNAHGFERMHTWLALAHAQIPVDIVHEKQIEDGLLEGYKVAYLSGAHLTQAAADKLRDWVQAGGTLVLTAGAGTRDQFNRPIDTLDALLPFKRDELKTLQAHPNSGIAIPNLKSQDTVTAGRAKLDVLAARQTFSDVKPGPQAAINATFADGTPAQITARVGRGQIVAQGYLPALDYIRKALVAKNEAIKPDPTHTQEPQRDDGVPGAEAIHAVRPEEKSYNPWEYPADVRDLIVAPVKRAKLDLPIRCSVPLVDAVYMVAPQGVLVPLANYTLKPIDTMTLDIAVDKPVKQVQSVHQGKLTFTQPEAGLIRVTLPLDCTDFITVAY